MIWENERNMKEILSKVRGKLCLQRDVLKFIEKHEREEDRRKKKPAGAPALIDGDGLIKKNSDGTHEPVKVFLAPTLIHGDGLIKRTEPMSLSKFF